MATTSNHNDTQNDDLSNDSPSKKPPDGGNLLPSSNLSNNILSENSPSEDFSVTTDHTFKPSGPMLATYIQHALPTEIVTQIFSFLPSKLLSCILPTSLYIFKIILPLLWSAPTIRTRRALPLFVDALSSPRAKLYRSHLRTGSLMIHYDCCAIQKKLRLRQDSCIFENCLGALAKDGGGVKRIEVTTDEKATKAIPLHLVPKYLPNAEQIRFDSEGTTPAFMRILGENIGLWANAKSLRSLNIRFVDDTAGVALSLVKANPKLEALRIILSRAIQKEEVTAIVKACGGLRNLFLSSCANLSQEEFVMIVKELPKLRRLRLVSPFITVEGVEEVLHFGPGLTELGISYGSVFLKTEGPFSIAAKEEWLKLVGDMAVTKLVERMEDL